MPRSDYLPFAFGDGANIVSQPDWVADPDREYGFGQGRAKSAKFNKAWRQVSTVAAGIGQFITHYSNIDVVDDGDHMRFADMFHQAIYDAIGGVPIASIVAGPGLTGGGTGPEVIIGLTIPVDFQHGGTGYSVYDEGDILYADTKTSLKRLPRDPDGFKFLTNQGVIGLHVGMPKWSLFDLTGEQLTGTLPIFNGGTGATTGFTALDNLAGVSPSQIGTLYRYDDGTWSVGPVHAVTSVIAGVGLSGGSQPGDTITGDITIDLEVPVTMDHGGTNSTALPVYDGGSLGIPQTLLTTNGSTVLPVSNANGSVGTISGPNMLFAAFNGNFPELMWFTANGPVDAPTTLTNGNHLGIISYRGYDGTGWSGNAIRIWAQTTEDWTASAHGTQLAIHTTEKGTTNFAVRLTVRSGLVVGTRPGGDQGDMGIGTINLGAVPYVDGVSIFLNSQLLGIPTAPTAGTGTATAQIATTAFVAAAIAAGGGGGGGAGAVVISDTAPASPTPGMLWWDSTIATAFMWYTDPTSSQWVPITSQPGPPGAYAVGAGLTMNVATDPDTIALTIPVAISSGGTGATTNTQALINLGAFPAAGGAINGVTTINGTTNPLPLQINTNAGTNCAINFQVTGQRAWQIGELSDGRLYIWDNTAAQNRLLIATDGSVTFTGQLYIPTAFSVNGVADANVYMLIKATGSGAREWWVGAQGGAGGRFMIWDQTRGSFGMIIDSNGASYFNNAAGAGITSALSVRALNTSSINNYWENSSAVFENATAFGQDVGAGITMLGRIDAANAWSAFSGMYGSKLNGTSGDTAGSLTLWARTGNIDFYGGNGQLGNGIRGRFDIYGQLQIINHIFTFSNNTGQCGTGGSAWNAVYSYAFNNASDPRDKKNIELLDNALDKVNSLQPVTYNWKDTEEDDMPKHHGFLAPDVHDIMGDRFGGWVQDRETGRQAINYNELTATLWRAVQELSTEVTELRAIVAAR